MQPDFDNSDSFINGTYTKGHTFGKLSCNFWRLMNYNISTRQLSFVEYDMILKSQFCYTNLFQVLM